MSYDAPTAEWSLEDIDRMIDLLEVIETPDFVPFTWPDLPVRYENGRKIMQMPYPIYHPMIGDLWKLLYDSTAFIAPYDPLPEDSDQKGIPFSVLGVDFALDYFSTATLNQIRRYLVLCTRGERFCDGHIASQFENGSFAAAYRRLKELRAALTDP